MKSILRILLITLLWTIPAASSAQIAAFERFADLSDVSYSYISKTMLQMASKHGKSAGKDSPLALIIDKLTAIQEISTADKGSGAKLIREVKDIAKSDKYELLVTIDKPTEQRFVYFKPKDSKHPVASVIIIKISGEGTIVIGLTGHFDANDLTSIIR